MIEPTESEDLAELDRFCDAMIAIRAEIAQVAEGVWPADDNPLVNAPHTARMLTRDWTHPYDREARPTRPVTRPASTGRRCGGSTARTGTATSCAPARPSRRSWTIPTRGATAGRRGARRPSERRHEPPSPLHAVHERLGATMTDFAGWSMPVRYDSDLAEHHAVRQRAGLFDLSHMGEIEVRGPQAADALDHAFVGDLTEVAIGRAKYTMLCAQDGGILDDVVVYHRDVDRYLVVANAANVATVLAELQRRRAPRSTSR
jgi:hypothetical protein